MRPKKADLLEAIAYYLEFITEDYTHFGAFYVIVIENKKLLEESTSYSLLAVQSSSFKVSKQWCRRIIKEQKTEPPRIMKIAALKPPNSPEKSRYLP